MTKHPDRVVESLAGACPHCDHALVPEDRRAFHAYDHVEFPPIRPVLTRVQRHRGICPCCRRGFSALDLQPSWTLEDAFLHTIQFVMPPDYRRKPKGDEPGWYEVVPDHEYGGDEFPLAYWTGTEWLTEGCEDVPHAADELTPRGERIETISPPLGGLHAKGLGKIPGKMFGP